MATTVVTLNGTAFPKCADVKEARKKIGKGWSAANGTPRFAQRAIKRQFTLRFEALSNTEVDALRTIQNLTAAFPFVDGHGVSTSVICMDEELTVDLENIDTASDAWYTVTLIVWEA